MFKEFKEFAMRGNVVDMAVGIIIGAAFGKIVSSLVQDIILPIIGSFGRFDFTALHLTIGESVIAYGNFIQTVVDFLIVAFSIFIVVRQMNRLKKREEAPKKAAPPRQEVLLEEIRDLLKKKK
ncbi:MAG: large-conductance mechanosensitive channel protein MscL [Candidatus Peregrinibacteria bacterium]|nr:large-conductance mechanosensitive channel protein MscL [Candidatus Peregrinibacteria bacterium]MCB9808265.1 large-conductance mechanosensitive channel protein MscL [Candidatus Peribacteria bacterium]